MFFRIKNIFGGNQSKENIKKDSKDECLEELNINNSIYELKLSERTYNALSRNGINKLEDFYPYRGDIRVLINFRWL